MRQNYLSKVPESCNVLGVILLIRKMSWQILIFFHFENCGCEASSAITRNRSSNLICYWKLQSGHWLLSVDTYIAITEELSLLNISNISNNNITEQWTLNKTIISLLRQRNHLLLVSFMSIFFVEMFSWYLISYSFEFWIFTFSKFNSFILLLF